MTVLERSSVQWGHTSIRYAVRRSARRVTVSIAVDPRGGVLLTAPAATSIDRLDRVVRTKARWIVQRLRRESDLPPPPADREFVSGETFRYLGTQYRLRVQQERATHVVLQHGHLVVSCPEAGDARRQAPAVRNALVVWYRRQAARRLPELAVAWAKRLGVAVTAVGLREQRRRWGSCDRAGSLRLNWRIVQAPRPCIEYVVAHEVVHVRHPNHTPAFWAALGRLLPDYDRRRGRLRELGPSLLW
ncbi:MAG TPA: SprT family zinc-dependent metalloprotease [Polyangiaceae bacterium]